MDYEKKYMDALAKARDMMSYKEVRREDMEYLFPELAESEDEKTRKEIIAFIKKRDRSGCDYDYDKWIAWLEKQKELTSEEEKQGKEDVLWCINQAKQHAKDENEMGTCWFAEKWLEKQKTKV